MNPKVTKIVIVLSFSSLMLCLLSNLLGVDNKVILSSVLGQLPIIGNVCTFFDIITLYRLQFELVNQHSWVALVTIIQIIVTLVLSIEIGKYSKQLGGLYCFFVITGLFCLENIFASHLIVKFVNIYQGLFTELEKELNELRCFTIFGIKA